MSHFARPILRIQDESMPSQNQVNHAFMGSFSKAYATAIVE